jgi:hypothetical protein
VLQGDGEGLVFRQLRLGCQDLIEDYRRRSKAKDNGNRDDQNFGKHRKSPFVIVEIKRQV